jgi:N-formylglutamate amidohydrolase
VSAGALVTTIPHSGEEIPADGDWLAGIPEAVLLTDVDRFVDRLYSDALAALGIPSVVARAHRYVADLNRLPEDVDADSVEGSPNPSGKFPKGFHWVVTTRGERLMRAPISRERHERIVALHHDAFHAEVARMRASARAPGRELFHLDLHSMPSRGTAAHADAGAARPDAVISDLEGRSCSARLRAAVVGAYEAEGFRVSVNWPYKGGRITERYGRPAEGAHAIQIELNRALYMDEVTREALPDFGGIPARLARALHRIQREN